MFCLKRVHGLVFCSNAVIFTHFFYFLSVWNTFLESIWNKVLVIPSLEYIGDMKQNIFQTIYIVKEQEIYSFHIALTSGTTTAKL